MTIPRMSDYDKKRNARVIARATTPQGGMIPEIDRNVTTVGTGQITATTAPQQLSYVSRNKMAMKLTNLSATVDVYWGTNSSLIPGDTGNGDLLPAGRGNWVNIPSPSIVFVATSTGTARISWAEAYDD